MDTTYPPEKIIPILQSNRLFGQFEEALLIELITFARVEYFTQNTKIIQENKPNKNIYIILEGCAAIYVGDELILKLRRKGDIIGEISVITKSLTTASVVADSSVVLFTIPAQKIYDSDQMELRALWFKLFSDILAQKLSMTNKKVVGFHETSAKLDWKKQELIQKTMILQSVLGSMDDGVVVTDGKGGVLHANQAFVRMVGGVPIPPRIRDWPDKIGFYMPDGQTACTAEDLPMAKAETGVLVNSEEIYINNDLLKSGIWVQATSSMLKTDDGKQLDGSVVVFRNTTKKKLEEKALIKAKENAEATAKAKSDFLSVMSHELRTPLNGILGMSDILYNTCLTLEQKECLDTISRSGHSLLEKIKNILFYNSIESGDVQIKKAPLFLNQILAEVIKNYEPAIQKKQMSIVADICNAAKDPLLGDKEMIFKAADNLINNAVKYSNTGVVNIIVTVKEQNDTSVKFLIQIKDNGIGLSPEKIQELFNPFFQADASYRRQFEGTGLGLAITKKVIEMMGGSIEVNSIPDQGSCFSFTLILSRADRIAVKNEAGTILNVKSLMNKNYAKKNPLTILVAEDNKINQLLIKKVLANLGYQIDIAENGLQAVEACINKNYDLVLMDIQMPVMDGLEATKQILASDPQRQLPVIVALTANTTEGFKETCLSAGMADYITKPLDVETLVRVLEGFSDILRPASLL